MQTKFHLKHNRVCYRPSQTVTAQAMLETPQTWRCSALVLVAGVPRWLTEELPVSWGKEAEGMVRETKLQREILTIQQDGSESTERDIVSCLGWQEE